MLVRRLALAAVLALATLGGCSASPDTSGPLPEGGSLVHDAAANLRDLHSVDFTFNVSGALPGLSIRELQGMATRTGPHGYARGRVEVHSVTDRGEYEFLLSGDTLRLTGADGGQVERAVPERLTPARLFGPPQDLSRLLGAATALRTEGREELHSVPTYRVTGELPKDAVSALLPGINADVDVKIWVRQADEHDLMRVWVQIPPRQQNEGAVTLELALSHHNASTESAPGRRG